MESEVILFWKQFFKKRICNCDYKLITDPWEGLMPAKGLMLAKFKLYADAKYYIYRMNKQLGPTV